MLVSHITSSKFNFTDIFPKECNFVLSVSNPDQLSPCSFTLSPDNNHAMSTCEVSVPEVEFHLEPKNEAFSLDDSIETDPEKEK